MRAFIFGFILLLGWTAFARYHYVCNIKNNCPETEVESPRKWNLNLMSGDEVILRNYQQFAFEPSSAEADLSNNNKKFLEEIAAYLDANPNKDLIINGAYTAQEKAPEDGMLENLGQVRADAIKNALKDLGIAPELLERVRIDGTMVEESEMSEPLRFLLSVDGDENSNKGMNFFNMSYSDANFEYAKADFKPGPQFTFYADSMKMHFDQNTTKDLLITGHTDHVGNDAYNMKLGLQRAKSAQQYLIKKGIAPNRIEVSTRGKREPIATNKTESGRQKNRRVNFKIR